MTTAASPPIAARMSEPAARGLTRRQAFQLGALMSVTASAAAGLSTSNAAATPLPTTIVAGDLILDPTALPVRWGTPTDLAVSTADQAWVATGDGTVLGYDRERRYWRPRPNVTWPGLVASGTAYMARWGRPTGPNQLVIVLGPVPEPTGSSPPPASSSPAPASSSPRPTSPSATASGAPVSTDPTPSLTPWAATETRSTPPQIPVGPAGGASGATARLAAGDLATTGFDATGMTVVAAAALAVGGGLMALARRRHRVAGRATSIVASPDGPGPPSPPSDRTR